MFNLPFQLCLFFFLSLAAAVVVPMVGGKASVCVCLRYIRWLFYPCLKCHIRDLVTSTGASWINPFHLLPSALPNPISKFGPCLNRTPLKDVECTHRTHSSQLFDILTGAGLSPLRFGFSPSPRFNVVLQPHGVGL